MTEPLRLSTVMGAVLASYAENHPLNPRQWQVCHHVLSCRTEALGESQWQCEHCGHEARFYHACRDRHCPRCQRQASERWRDRQLSQTLEVAYHHVVFTVPEALNAWAELHPEVLYDQILKSTWETLKTFAADPKRLDGQLGATLVLHTWGQTLVRHLHVHCLVPGGALGADGAWHPARSTYLFPVRALSRYFRGHLVASLRRRFEAGELHRLANAGELKRLLDALMAQEWVVYSKACLGHSDTVVSYLARYSHRTALSDSRLVDFQDGQVRLRYRDYRDGDRQKILSLSSEELLRRFLLHVLPKGLMRIRHYGFLANRCREAKLATIREAIGQAEADTVESSEPARSVIGCPHCRVGRLRLVLIAMPEGGSLRSQTLPRYPDRRH